MSDGEQLTRRTATGAGTLIVTRLVTRGIDFLSLAILARLLMPADFGLVAIAMTLVLICEAITDLPISQAVVRLPFLNNDHLDTAFTISVLRGCAIAVGLCLLAWPFAVLYEDMRLVPLICALGLSPAFRGICNPRFATFARNLDFRREMLVEIGTKVTSLAVAASVAWATRSYWALAAGTITGPLAMNLIAYALAPWRLRLTLVEWPVFARFLSWASAGQVLNAFSWQIDQLTLGRFVPRQQLGYFTIASTLAFLPFQVVITQVARPVVAGLAKLQHDPQRLASAYSLGSNTLITLCMPVMVGLSILADPIVLLALGPKWEQTAYVLRWLSLATIPALFVAPAGALAMALNRTDLGFRLSAAEFAIRLPLTCLAAVQAGITGVIVARASVTLLMTIYAMHLVKKMIGLAFSAQILGAWRALVASGILAGVVDAAWSFAPPITSPLLLGLWLGATALWGGALYVATLLLLWRIADRPPGPEHRATALVAALADRFLMRKAAHP
jgi:O-antigen/teichoic acid export membrane protein